MTDEAALEVNVVNANQALHAHNDVAVVNEGSSTGITLIGSDPDDDILTFAVVTNPTHGRLSLAGAVAIYTPVIGYHGLYSSTFRVSDEMATSNSGTISITVNSLKLFRQRLVGYGMAVELDDDPDSDGISNIVRGLRHWWESSESCGD
jgi:hypothetical protein